MLVNAKQQQVSVVVGLLMMISMGSLFPASAENKRTPAFRARDIIQTTGIKGGLIVQIGCGDGRLTAALRINDRYQVHGLDRDAVHVAQARKQIRSQGLYGNVSVDRLSGNRLPYVDNLVNLVVSDDLGDVATSEVLRVLAPSGVAYLKRDGRWTRIVKPRPKNIDDWTHYMHDASGNAVAHDEVVGPPRHLQWIGSPRWSRHHDRMASTSALVSAGGRIFYIMDEGSRVSILLPPKWALIARDAFNGSILWKQPIKTWNNHLWPLKSGPTQLARRLITTGNVVYVTLGFRAPLTALDAATGKILRTYEETNPTEEVIFSDGVLYLLVNTGKMELAKYAPGLNVGDQQRVAREFFWNKQPRTVMAVEAATGRVLWKKTSRVSPITLAAAQGCVLYHDGSKVVCLNSKDGSEIWSSPPAKTRRTVTMNFGPKLVIYGDVVLYAGGDRKMQAFAVDRGKQLWTAPHGASGYASPEDLLVSGGLVWNAPTTSGRLSGNFTGRDPRTGEVKSEFPPDVKTYWFHHRCYMAKATDRFLLPSRTGIEFVDYRKKHWDINDWVRGGCLYGIMPCNGLVYTPPHDCACYPEAKLSGLNALAPESKTRRFVGDVPATGRLEHGPAYGKPLVRNNAEEKRLSKANSSDWPTYRHDAQRSGFIQTAVPIKLNRAWQGQLGGRLSAPTIADGRLFVAQIDAHTLHALDAASGRKLWTYTAGGRIDSPPTIDHGRVLFGSADGFVYSLRAADGALIWRFRAAPRDERLMAFEQLESVWPVHGSVLVQDGAVYFVAGRSNFLDGGLRWIKLDVNSGRKLAEVVLDQRDPKTGKNLQDRVAVLNMPVGLPDVLSGDGRFVYMRSQRFDLEGRRQEIGPHSGDAAAQGSEQHGVGAHLFAPMGFLDGTWFHRSYWVYGRSFAGGHNGYYQAARFAPAGRILTFDESNVYGFGRKPQYLRWTTTLEYQLFAVGKHPPQVPQQARTLQRRRGGGSMIVVPKSASLNPVGKPLVVEAWVKAKRPNGVIVARGGPAHGYALILRGGKPRFVVRSGSDNLTSVTAKKSVGDKWVHLVGVLTETKQLGLYVNGELAASGKAAGLIASNPAQTLDIGADGKGAVGDYKSPFGLTGLIDEVRVYYGPITAAEIKDRYEHPDKATPQNAKTVLSFSFDKGDAQDASGRKNHGRLSGVGPAPGRFGRAMRFTGKGGGGRRNNRSYVQYHWTQDLPLFVRAMVLCRQSTGDGKTLFIAGPPDITDEESAFKRLTSRDPKVQAILARQDAALNGSRAGLLRAVSTADGSTLAKYSLPSLPVWDGMAAADGRLYLSTTDGRVLCFGNRSQPE